MSRHWTACWRSALWIASFITLTGLMNRSLSGQQTDPADEDAREKLVVLVTGRMLTGHVTRNAGGYLVEQSSGRVQVELDDVKFVVNDLKEAYRKHRDSIVEPTPATHIALANWCISYRLHEEARDELKLCLKRDPTNAEGRRLLQRLTDTIRSEQPPRIEEPPPPKNAIGFVQPPTESLGGLSAEMATQFTSRIQPLLMNKCGNASCHGAASSTDFRLTMSRGAGKGNRQTTERNLYEVMRFIDLESVPSSQLLKAAQGNHGGKGTIFVGSAGTEQTKLLREWAKLVANEKVAANEKVEHRPRLPGTSRPKNHVVQAKAVNRERAVEIPTDDDLETSEPDILQASVKEPRKLPPVKADPTDALELAKEPTDAFDPKIFNRRFHRP